MMTAYELTVISLLSIMVLIMVGVALFYAGKIWVTLANWEKVGTILLMGLMVGMDVFVIINWFNTMLLR